MFDSSACSPSLEWATFEPSTSTSEPGASPPRRAASPESREVAILSPKEFPSIECGETYKERSADAERSFKIQTGEDEPAASYCSFDWICFAWSRCAWMFGAAFW